MPRIDHIGPRLILTLMLLLIASLAPSSDAASPYPTALIIGVVSTSFMMPDDDHDDDHGGGGGTGGAGTYFVRISGSDSNDGLTPATAWRTINYAGQTLIAGDTVYVGAGSYVEESKIENDGTSSNPIKFIADITGAQTGDAGAVILSKSGKTALKIDKADYVQIFNFTIQSSKKGVEWKEASGGLLQDCEIKNHTEKGVEIDKSEVTITTSTIHDNSDEGLKVKEDSDVTVTGSDIYSNGKQGVKCDKSNTTLAFTRCNIYSNSDQGLELKKCATTMTNCLVRNNGKEGIHLKDDSATSVTLWHVTIANNSKDGIKQDKGTLTLTNCIIANNSEDGLEFKNGTLTHTYNLVYGNGTSDYKGTSAHSTELSFDPLFTGGADYTLQSSSPAIDAGTDASLYTAVDLNNGSRPVAAGWDMGSYEFGAGGSPTPTIVQWAEVSP